MLNSQVLVGVNDTLVQKYGLLELQHSLEPQIELILIFQDVEKLPENVQELGYGCRDHYNFAFLSDFGDKLD